MKIFGTDQLADAFVMRKMPVSKIGCRERVNERVNVGTTHSRGGEACGCYRSHQTAGWQHYRWVHYRQQAQCGLDVTGTCHCIMSHHIAVYYIGVCLCMSLFLHVFVYLQWVCASWHGGRIRAQVRVCVRACKCMCSWVFFPSIL